MKRRTFLTGTIFACAATYTGPFRSAQAQNSSGTAGTFEPLRLSLSTPGRLGFYVDYSEMTSTGIHTFYVCRTHGTEGAVSVDYSTSGDSHSAVSGTFTWGDGEADIKFFTVEVPSKQPGTHRISAVLSNPTGGSVLHFGERHTVAYGVIDDGSISSDAVFFDTEVTANGSGTIADPYNNIYDAIANVGSRRYIYGSGTTVIDGTNTERPFSDSLECILPPAGRRNESERLYVQQWPGRSNFVVEGDGTSNNQAGFLTADSSRGSWVTYRGIRFQNLDQSSGDTWGGAIGYIYAAEGTGVNVEYCSFNNLNTASGQNISSIMPWGATGWKIWRCDANNIQVNGDNTNGNAVGLVETYDGTYISIQRCRMSNCNSGIFHKRIASPGVDVSLNVKFSHFVGCTARYERSGTGGASHSFSIVQGNLFDNVTNDLSAIWHKADNPNNVGQKAGWWCNNVFDTCGGGERAAIFMRGANGAMIFNNIMLDCRSVWGDERDLSPEFEIDYADHNIHFGTTYYPYRWRGDFYDSASALNSASGHEANSIVSNPQFQNASSGNYALRETSPALSAGVGGSRCGIFLTGIESVGPGESSTAPVPARMPPVSVT